ncbi:MAG: hypothetical protein U9N62_11970 [Thermotogota bacterium]|nr:hypothetical protein [Thermotogota bacterium]
MVNIEGKYYQEKGIEPKFIVSGILAAIVEVLLIVALLFVLNSSPYETEREEYLSININMSPSKAEPKVEEAVVQQQPEPVVPKEQEINKQPDPLFEALKTFEAQESQKVEGVTSGIRPVEVSQPENPLNVPKSIFEQRTLDFNQIQAAPPTKKNIDSDVLFSLADPTNNQVQSAQIIDLNALEQYDIPNLDSVKTGLQQDYQALLKKPGIRKETVSGQVIVELYITGSSANTLVNISSAVSPELANIVVKNLKLLYIPDRIDPLRLQVSVSFRAN